MLQTLATALPMMRKGALTHCCDQAAALRTALSPEAADGAWEPAVAASLAALQAQGTELSQLASDERSSNATADERGALSLLAASV